MSINIFAIKDSANLTMKSKSTGKPVIYADYATQSVNEWSSDRVYAMSKSTRAVAFDSNKQSTLAVSMEIFDLKWLAILNGQDFVTGATSVFKRDVITVDATNKASIVETPLASSMTVFKLESDMLTHGVEQTLGTPGTTVNTYSITAKELTFNATSCPVGTKIVVYYAYTSGVTSQKLSFSSVKFPENYSIVSDTMIRDLDGVDKFVQLTYLNVKPQPNFTLTLSATDIATLEITFDVLKDSTSDDMATFTII